MSDEPNPKIVQPGEVEFDGAGATQPDSLDDRVAQATQIPVQSNAQADVEHMRFLGESVKALFARVASDVDNYGGVGRWVEVAVEPIKFLLPEVLFLKKTSYSVAAIQVTAVKPERMTAFLEEIYGPEVAQTGVYDAIGIPTGTVKVDQLIRYLPEFGPLAGLRNKYIQVLNNPYLTILTMPVEGRAFFTGVTRELVKQGLTIDNAGITDFRKPWKFADVLAYAKKRGEVDKVRKYMDMYLGDTP